MGAWRMTPPRVILAPGLETPRIITGLWQVSGRSDTSYAQRVALDVAYVSSPSVWTDVKILLRTPVAVLSRRGAC